MKNKNNYPFRDEKLPVKKRAADLVERLTLDEKIGLLSVHQQAIPRLGISEWEIWTEIARGFVGREEGEYSTVFPQPIGLASTFNPALMRELGEIAGTEARIYYQKRPISRLMLFGPTVDLLRHPLWGRNEEGYGEDPFLTGEMSSAYTRGLRGDGKKHLRAVSILKHFCCNNHEEERGKDDANVEPRTLREYYYAAFEPAIRRENAFAVMTAYNELSGVPAMINPDLTDVCRKEWGMLFAVTDGEDFTQNVNLHKYCASHAETLALALKAGNCAMCDDHETVAAAAKSAVKRGLITEKDIDRRITETLTARFLLGEFDESCEFNIPADISESKLNCDEFKAANARAARECITLLKNGGLLPLKAGENTKIAVIGPLADAYYPDWYTGITDYYITILDGLKNAFGEDNVSYHDGADIVAIKSAFNGKYLGVTEDGSIYADADEITPACRFKKTDWGGAVVYVSELNGKLIRVSDGGFIDAAGKNSYEWFGKTIFSCEVYDGKTCFYKDCRNKYLGVDTTWEFINTDNLTPLKENLFTEEILLDGAAEAAKLAEKADYAIVAAGNNPMVIAREEHDRKTLNLPFEQRFLTGSVLAANKNTVLVINASYPYALGELTEELPAIVYTAHGGPESGNAVADVLTGKYNPAGRTPQTWYKNEKDLPGIKEYDITRGLTYLYFEGEPLYPFGHGLSYSSFEYSDFTVKDAGKNIEARLKVKNASEIYGEEVVQLYFTALEPRVKRPKKQLCEFIRQGIEPGKTADFVFVFDKERLRFWDVTRNKFAVETGEYRFYAAASSSDIRAEAEISVKGEKIPPRNLAKITRAIDYDAKNGVKIRYDKERQRHYVNTPRNNEGVIEYYDCMLKGVSGIELAAAPDDGVGNIRVFANGKQICEVKVPASPSPAAFKKVRAGFKPLSGKTGKLTLKLSSETNLLEFRLIGG